MKLFHERLGHSFTRSLLAGDTAIFGGILRSGYILNHSAHYVRSPQWIRILDQRQQWIPRLLSNGRSWKAYQLHLPKVLTKYTTFDHYLLIVDAYFKIPKLYGMENITAEWVMEKLDMFQAIFGKVYEFCWWDIEIIKTDSVTKFAFKDS